MAENSNARCVVTVPLKTEKWQEDILFKRFEICRSIYNAMLGYELKKYRKMLRDPAYIKSKEIIHNAYKAKEEKEKKKKSPEYKEAVDTQRRLLKEYGFSEYAFFSDVIRFREHYASSIPSVVARASVAKPMWAAFDKLLFGNGEIVHFKKYDSFSSIASTEMSGIYIINEKGKSVTHRGDNKALFVCMTGKGKKKMHLPLKIDPKDYYTLEMLEKEFKTIRIVRKKVKGTYKYSVQLCVVGLPAIKYDKHTGEVKHPIGKGKIGVYVDTTSCTVVSKNGTVFFDLSKNIPVEEEQIAKLQQYMDTSRRISNPENYNPDGTIKHGIMKDGQRMPLTWTFSNGYLKAKEEAANLYRIVAEKRTLQRHILANQILAMGDEVVVNDYPFQLAALRQTGFAAIRTPDGTINAGKDIGTNAPALLVTLMEQKLISSGYSGLTKVKLKDVDYQLDGYRNFYAQAMFDGSIQ